MMQQILAPCEKIAKGSHGKERHSISQNMTPNGHSGIGGVVSLQANEFQ